ncbi:lipopolysaccharide assembly protein LapB [Lutibacter sp.]|uniref:type IX secretion system periplasmic lipoprotein PorW/SprE n=1 Tax=Lutibacter sp. TaxID=1925666 RepID=UPI00273746C3|nr:tetratricopeptide repeat protein [Lutibacter sp.]MDP3313185.1 tetratricopeptide repeat protein [Lutibacter sp.]
MKNTFKIGFGFLFLIVAGCSTKKDAFLNRSFHSTTTKYNVLFNGKEALEQGLDQLNANYEDNYLEILPIEPLKVEILALPGMEADKDGSPIEFEKAEEKAVKAIQKHSMLIARQERNKQIDDAYLLLGKSRYYSKRFVPALEAFNFVIENYPKANLINETKVWHAKTLIRLQNEEQAIENLKKVLKGTDLSDDVKERAHTAMAMAYSSINNSDLALLHLKKAVKTDVNKEQTARNLFVLGQMYGSKKLKDSANLTFTKLLDLKKAPKKYKIRAELEKAKIATNKLDILNSKETLVKLSNDRTNKPFFSEIYHQLGLLEKATNETQAISFFQNSLNANPNFNVQKELTYQELGDLYFEKAAFVTASKYYDSILNITSSDNSKRVLSLTRKRNNLNEVINYEAIAKNSDSILELVAMNEEERINYFTDHIQKVKQAKEKQQKKINTGSGFLNFKSNDETSNNAGKWYFYNLQAEGFGQQEFSRIWGNRPLEDNWRLSDKSKLQSASSINKITQNQTIPINGNEPTVEQYLSKIPNDKYLIDSISSQRNNAYFKLGLIYKDQFNENEIALEKFEKLLTFKPEEQLIITSKYHIYKIYSQTDKEKSEVLKSEFVAIYPKSVYTQYILNPNVLIVNSDQKASEKEYALVFYDYKEELYDVVIEKATKAINTYEGLPIVPKFELLRAYAIGKREGLEAFKKALDFIAMNYPNTEESKKALEVIATINTKL